MLARPRLLDRSTDAIGRLPGLRCLRAKLARRRDRFDSHGDPRSPGVAEVPYRQTGAIEAVPPAIVRGRRQALPNCGHRLPSRALVRWAGASACGDGGIYEAG